MPAGEQPFGFAQDKQAAPVQQA